uniref:Putative RNA-binding protein n=1 Tax=Trypanosoma congolense (strain IL3000) TaxID=1068625 RepID=G0UPH1_TRYCI|nr:putative RNA-binding protein [Trypanosoma congolense IL3000]
MQRFKEGNSGAYSEAYHKLLGKSSWIVIRHLECSGGPGKANTSSGGDGVASGVPSEGDLATVFSQFGEVSDVRFVRNPRNGRFMGTAFVKFEDYRSCILAADTMNSNREKGKEVRLTASAKEGQGLRGIEVARCEEAEVCPLPSGAESYAEWLGKLAACH